MDIVEPDPDWGYLAGIGGGVLIPTIASPDVYLRAASNFAERLKDDDWQNWWKSTNLPPGELYHWWVDKTKPRIQVRKYSKKVILDIERINPSFDPGVSGLADDLNEIFGRVRSRFKTTIYPDIIYSDFEYCGP